MKRSIILGATLATIACSAREEPQAEPPQTICTLEARAGLLVTVLDAATGRNLAPDANVRVTDGEYSEMLNPIEGTYVGAYERAGTYTVVVSAPGHAQWQRIGVTVGRDECHVVAEQVEARLTPD